MFNCDMAMLYFQEQYRYNGIRKHCAKKETKSEKETTYYITINIYDLKDAQEKECTTVNNLNQLNVKLDKKIPVFIKGKK